jgi:hypothetical protein
MTRRDVKLSIGSSVHDPTDPVGRLLFNVPAMVAEFESDLIHFREPKCRNRTGRVERRAPRAPQRRLGTLMTEPEVVTVDWSAEQAAEVLAAL